MSQIPMQPGLPEFPDFTGGGPGGSGYSGPATPGGSYFPRTYSTKPQALDIAQLDQFRAAPLPKGYPETFRTLYSPVDQVKPALAYLLSSAQQSLVLSVYGFDDDDLAEIIKEKLADPKIFVQLTLDSSQAAGAHEKLLLSQMEYPASSIAIGRSERGAIIHLKLAVIDGLFVVGGSTNWSTSGETKQDNELTIHMDPYVAAEATTRISRLHAYVLQEAKK